MPEILSTSLFREVCDAVFFRVLGGRNGPAYIDMLDALDRECEEQPDGLDRAEAVEIARSDTGRVGQKGGIK
ncbi:MAG: hypothetical protein K1X78_11355 [Verrucomicrobiaceae bacterium]|nr:hypothetical protein [Verrucomicrobiaceae bacterium]